MSIQSALRHGKTRRRRRAHLGQLRSLAKKYHFPLAVFYLPAPPRDFAPLRDFRRLPEFEDGTISPNLAYHIRNAHERRELALELQRRTAHQAPTFPPKSIGAGTIPKKSGKRSAIFSASRTKPRRRRRGPTAPLISGGERWRNGTFSFSSSAARITAWTSPEMRGFAIAKPEFPVIVVNGKDYSQGGKAFTLVHELVHILLGESAISNGGAEDLNATREEQVIERFCDAVAAAALMPRRLVLSFPIAQDDGVREWTNDELRTIARAIGVSRHALLLRFVSLRRATGTITKRMRAQFEDENRKAADKRGKKPVKIKRPVMLMSWNGRGYTRLCSAAITTSA